MTLPHTFWQMIGEPVAVDPAAGFDHMFPARFPDERCLPLPIRVLPGDGRSAVASLIVNQASFAVADALADAMATLAQAHTPEVIVAVPTLGLGLAEAVARRLGHTRLVPLGTSRKFWYQDELSEPLKSITTPGGGKTLFVDPRMIPLLADRRIVVIDDVVSSGASMRTVLRLLDKAGVRPAAVVVAMLQSAKWRALAAETNVTIEGVLRTPRLALHDDGRWRPDPSDV